MVYKFDESNFDAEVLQSDLPVFVDFYADWCGPCKMMSPVIDKLAEEYEGKIKVGKVNVDENGDLAVKYGIMSIPNMIFFKAPTELNDAHACGMEGVAFQATRTRRSGSHCEP